MPSEHTHRGRKRAREARAALGLDPGAPLADLLTAVEEDAGLSVIVTRRLPEKVAGACVRDGGSALLWVNGAHATARQRFTLAHELGHAWLRHAGALPVETSATLAGRPTSPPEIEANAFAAEFLVPRAGLEQVVTGDPTLEHVVVIAAHYGVSAIVVAYRIRELALVSAERCGRLEREIEDGLHGELRRSLPLSVPDDRLAGIGELPYLSPRLEATLLGAVLDGGAADPRLVAAIRRLL
jgi:Zn-dependent peptidase ImmA (M78 family)